MKFGIIVCPKCKSSRVVDLSFKTSTCFRCNKKIDLNKVKILFECNSSEEARTAIGDVNRKLLKKS